MSTELPRPLHQTAQTAATWSTPIFFVLAFTDTNKSYIALSSFICSKSLPLVWFRKHLSSFKNRPFVNSGHTTTSPPSPLIIRATCNSNQTENVVPRCLTECISILLHVVSQQFLSQQFSSNSRFTVKAPFHLFHSVETGFHKPRLHSYLRSPGIRALWSTAMYSAYDVRPWYVHGFREHSLIASGISSKPFIEYRIVYPTLSSLPSSSPGMPVMTLCLAVLSSCHRSLAQCGAPPSSSVSQRCTAAQLSATETTHPPSSTTALTESLQSQHTMLEPKHHLVLLVYSAYS